MHTPNAIFIDTSIFDGQQYNFSSTAFSSLMLATKGEKLKYLLPDPTEREIKRHIHERSMDALRALQEARRKAPFLTKWDDFSQVRLDEDQLPLRWRLAAFNEWQAFQKHFEVLRLGYDDIKISTIMDWYDQQKPPFREKKKRKEFPDAFAIAILESYAQQEGVQIAVVSADPDFKLACERYPRLLYFSNLPSLAELLLAPIARVAAIKPKILESISKLEMAIQMRPIDFYCEDDNFELMGSQILGVVVRQLNVVGVGEHACTLAFEADILSQHTASPNDWLDPEYYHYDTETIEDESRVLGTAKVELDKDRRIEAVTSIELDFNEIRIRSLAHGWG